VLCIHYKKTTGEIISYGEEANDIPDECELLRLPSNTNIFGPGGEIGKKVRLRDVTLVPYRLSLLGWRRVCVLAEEAAKTPAGNFVELGVYRGGTAWQLLEVADEQGRELHLFDTFTGIPYKGPMDRVDVGVFSDVDLDEVKELLPGAKFYVGLFPDTLTNDVQNIAFVHCDMDTYQATKAVKPALWDRMVEGGKIFFDDLDIEGVATAIREDFGDARWHRDLNMMYVVK
jgi:hypothetical protein